VAKIVVEKFRPSAFPKVDPTISAPQNVRRFNGSRAKGPIEL
jgi:hypothetical protein